MTAKHILIVEDEKKIADLLCDYLKAAGFRTSAQNNGDRVISQVKKDPPNLILLDIMLPGKDGMQLCRAIRQFSNVPIIMITARVEEIDRLLGLELGADDYICKPFSPREVVARVRAVFRRVDAEPREDHLVVGSISLDDETHQVMIDKKVLNLTPNEFGLLKIMMSRPNRVFSRNELISRVQGYDFEGYDRTIDTHIKNLRKKIARRLPNREIISTVYGVGYKFKAPLD
ncbi:MAG: response regulator [Desulfobacteraceae bacterium]|jgi:two-component system response regulator BaeR|nr:response regulator [Desulfobacteraceae bacterium]